MELLRFILIQQTLEDRSRNPVFSKNRVSEIPNDKPKENAFGIILSIIIMSMVGFSLYFFGSDKQTDEGNFFTDIRDKFEDWLEQSKCDALRRELLGLVQQQEELADRLIDNAKSEDPGNTEGWYLEKVIYDLKRDR